MQGRCTALLHTAGMTSENGSVQALAPMSGVCKARESRICATFRWAARA